jgi:hypothetical protein
MSPTTNTTNGQPSLWYQDCGDEKIEEGAIPTMAVKIVQTQNQKMSPEMRRKDLAQLFSLSLNLFLAGQLPISNSLC